MAGGKGEVAPITDAAIEEARRKQREYGPDEKSLTRDLVMEIMVRTAVLNGQSVSVLES